MSPGPEDLLSQREKRDILENDRRVRERASTYHQFTVDEADVPRGRYSAHEASTVVGSTAAPVYPAAFQQHDPVPDEPPLGISVNEMIPVGEPHEIAVSSGEVGHQLPAEPDGGEEQRRGSPENAVQSTPSPPTSADEDEPPRAA